MHRSALALLLAAERKLKDEQEERWRAYLILRDAAASASCLLCCGDNRILL